MSLVPAPVPLGPPPGSPGPVADAAAGTASGARLLEELAERLATARPPAWQGADAEAADTRRVRIARLADDAAEALHRVSAQLTVHADLLGQVHARIAVLRAAQDEEFALARARVAVPWDPADPLAAEPAVVLESLRIAEEARSAEHAQLLARLADGTAETVRVLAGCAAAVSGGPGADPDTALARLAAVLPGWGAPELARRGRLLADRLRDGGGTPEDLAAAVTADLDLAAGPAYAAAVLDRLGPDLTAALFGTAWNGPEAAGAWTGLLARAVSGLGRDSAGPPWLSSLLADARSTGNARAVTGGLAAVLARARADGLAGPPPALAAVWARALVEEERRTGLPADLGTPPAGADPAACDPLALVLESLVEQRAAVELARAMSDRDAWTVLLSHGWNDGGALRDAVMTAVADAPGQAARPALRSALVALGTGLEDGDPGDWPFVEPVVAGAVPGLAAALLRHVDVLVPPLAGGATGSADPVSVTALRGLAVAVALDAREHGSVGDLVEQALCRPRPGHVGPRPDGTALPSVAVPAAFVAVREHGADLTHAMEQHRRRDDAETRAHFWDWTFGVPFTLMGSLPVVGWLSGGLEAVVTRVLGTDASFDNSRDRGRHHTGAEAMGESVAGLERGSGERAAAAREAVTAFSATIGVLGEPVGPVAPDEPLGGEVAEAVVRDALGGAVAARLGVQPPFDAAVGELITSGAGELAGAAD